MTNQPPSIGKRQFSIRLIMVITIIFAANSAAAGYLYRAANGQTEEIGIFIIVSATAPLGVMIALSWLFRLFRKL